MWRTVACRRMARASAALVLQSSSEGMALWRRSGFDHWIGAIESGEFPREFVGTD